MPGFTALLPFIVDYPLAISVQYLGGSERDSERERAVRRYARGCLRLQRYPWGAHARRRHVKVPNERTNVQKV